jgi:NADPH2 dehydrogenase
VPVVPQTYPGYQIPHAETIRKMTGLPVSAGGLITDPKEVEGILADNRADLVYLGRELLRNPYWVLHAAKTLEYDLTWPKQYERAKPR